MSQPTRLEFHPLTFVPESEGVLVGRAETDSYAVLPADGAELLHRLADGMPVADAEGWYMSSFGQSVDMADFIATLADLGFIRVSGDDAPPRRVRYQALGRAFFSPAAWACYAAIVIACTVALIRHTQLRPVPKDVFFTQSLIIVQAVLIAVQLPAIGWHEWFHILAGRRLGLPTRLRVSRRLYFAVFETHLNSLLGVPRRQRYLPFLVGMLADVLLYCALVLAADAIGGRMPWAQRLAIAIAYTTLLRLAWQFCLFLRTDPYYALTTALGCENLAEASSAYLRNRLRRARNGQRTHDDAAWSARDRAMAPWFAALNVVGTTALLVLAAYAVIPVAVIFVARLESGLAHRNVASARFWDAAISLGFVVLQFGIMPFLAGRRGRSGRQRTQPKGIPA